MITEKNVTFINETRKVSEFVGLSTDTKPSGELNGSSFFAIDEGVTYFYDEDGEQWINPFEAESE